MKRRFVVAALVAVPACACAEVSASDLFAAHLQFQDPTPLYSANQSSGALTALGDTHFDDIADLTSDPRNGTLWGVNVKTNQLITINQHTGAANAAAQLDSKEPIVSIAFDPVTRKLYGNSALGFGAVADALYRIDPITGVTTRIDEIKSAQNASFEKIYGLGFDQHGTLFGVSDSNHELLKIDTSTATGTFVAKLGVEHAFDLASRPEDNVMFLADSGTHALYTLDTSSGALTPVGPYGSDTNIAGLAFLNPAPEPSTYVVTALGLAALAWLRRRTMR